MVEQRGFEREQSLKREAYFSEGYFERQQLFSLAEQIALAHRYATVFEKCRILEVGIGNGFVADFMKKAGYRVTTFDINPELRPDIVGNLLNLQRHISETYELVLCSEVLEHMPQEHFDTALEQLGCASSRYVVITLPVFRHFVGFNLQLKLPRLPFIDLPCFVKTSFGKRLGSGHFWEIGYDSNSSRKAVESVILRHFRIVEKGAFRSNPYHNYYVLEVAEAHEL